MKILLTMRLVLIISLGVASLFLSGCTHYYYVPNMQNVPAFQQKGESRFDLSVSTGDGWTAFELQGAHAFSDHVGAVLNFASGGGRVDEYGSGHGTVVEGGAGYFYPAGEHFVFETYGQLGYGDVKNSYTNKSTPNSSVDYLKFSVQPAIGVRNSIVELFLSLRMATLNYMSINQSFILDSLDRTDLDYIHNHSSSFLAEPALTIRLGYNYVKFQLQICRSVNLSAPEFPQEGSNLNVGLMFTIPPKTRVTH